MRWTGTRTRLRRTAPNTACLSRQPRPCSTTHSISLSRISIQMVIAGKLSGWLDPSCCLSFTRGRKVMTTRSAASSALARLPRTKGKPMKKKVSELLAPAQLAELELLARLPDDAIDTSDAREVLDWSNAKRGVFYRPVKQQLNSSPRRRCGRLVQGPSEVRERLPDTYQPSAARICRVAGRDQHRRAR